MTAETVTPAPASASSSLGPHVVCLIHARRAELPVTFVLVEGCADDVSAYQAPGHVSWDDALARGSKLTHRAALERGIPLPADKHYRL